MVIEKQKNLCQLYVQKRKRNSNTTQKIVIKSQQKRTKDEGKKKEKPTKEKLEYLFENVEEFTTFNKTNMGPQEKRRYYDFLLNKVLDDEEKSSITTFIIASEKEIEKMQSIIRLETGTNSKGEKEYEFYRLSRQNNMSERIDKEKIFEEYDKNEPWIMVESNTLRDVSKEDILFGEERQIDELE